MNPDPSVHSVARLKDERRGETRRWIESFYSVEIFDRTLFRHYQFKIRDISDQGLSILVRDDSDLLPHFAVGNVMEMTFRSKRFPGKICSISVEVRHISPDPATKTSRHHRIGFRILDPPIDEACL